MKDTSTKKHIEQAIRRIVNLRRIGEDTGDFTFEEVDNFIAETGSRIIEEVDNMPEPQFLMYLLETMMEDTKQMRESID